MLLGVSYGFPQCPRSGQHTQSEMVANLIPLPPSLSHMLSAMAPCLPLAPKRSLELNAFGNISLILSTLVTTYVGDGTRIYTE